MQFRGTSIIKVRKKKGNHGNVYNPVMGCGGLNGKCPPDRLRCLNPRTLGGGTVKGSYGTLRRWSLVGGSESLEGGF